MAPVLDARASLRGHVTCQRFRGNQPPPSIHHDRPPHKRSRRSVRTVPAAGQQSAGESLTSRVFRQVEESAAAAEQQAPGAGGSTGAEALRRADAAWRALRGPGAGCEGPAPQFVVTSEEALAGAPEVDVAVCGGTLGVFLALSLQLAGLSVAVVERGPLAGRAQEWNISRAELAVLVEMGLLSRQEAEDCISIEFNPVRAGFAGSPDVWTSDVLNLGVKPAALVAAAQRRFEAAGGRVLERTPLDGIEVRPGGALLWLGAGAGALSARLVLDVMGHASPVVRQARWGQRPDGVCCVVGSCAAGFPPDANTTGDIIYTTANSLPASADAGAPGSLQYYWEAFPAGTGPDHRTTYMFSYMDASQERPSLEALMEAYWEAMPAYQGVALADLEVLRVLHGVFPTYRDSPLRPAFDRVLQAGDASGIQSPLSFGGFGALTRHLPRLTAAVTEAVRADALDRDSLAAINAYNPGLSGAWMLQKAMSIPAGSTSHDPAFINRLLGGNFGVMAGMGEATLRPFLQDVIKFGPMGRTLLAQMASDPGFVLQILGTVGPAAILDWVRHFAALGLYTALHATAGPAVRGAAEALPPRQRYAARRLADAWEYGSGGDYH